MASLSLNASPEEIEEELTFTDVLMASLDEGADDYDTKLAELQATKDELQRRLDNHDYSNSRPSSGGQFGFGGMDGFNDQFQQQWGGQSGTGGYGYGGGPMNGYGSGSTDGFSGAGSKRPLSGALTAFNHQHPHKRPTPDPSNANTPSSSASSDTFGDPFDHLHGSRMSQVEIQRQQRLEAIRRRQREQELADEQLARSLSQRESRPSSTAPSSSRNTFQTTLGFNGALQRPPPPIVKTEPAMPQQVRSNLAYGYPPPAYAEAPEPRASLPRIKPEPRLPIQQLPERPHPTPTGRSNGVIDLTGSDSEDNDVNEISASQFTPSRRATRPIKNEYGAFAPPQMPGSYPTPYSNGTPSIYVSGNNPNGYAQAGPSSFGRLQAPLSAISNAVGGLKYATGSFAGRLSEMATLINGSGFNHVPNPFDNDDLVYSGSRALGGAYADPYANHGDLFRDRYNDIYNADPTKTKQEIEALLANIRPDEEMPAELRVPTPEALTVTLHRYQEMGLTWMKEMEEDNNKKGGILADDMGLGKTIQMISLLVTRKSEDERCKTTLVIAPVALLRQWKQEIEGKVQPGFRHRLHVFIHHGQQKKKSFAELRMFDVVITTYGCIAAEMKRLENFRLRQKNDPAARMRPSEQCALIADECKWYRLVLDEAQCIKNKNTQSAKASFLLQAKYRWCMTGTPMMNNVDEFFSLIHFLRIKPYCQWEKFRVDFSRPLTTGRDWKVDQAMQKFQALCKAIMLRRTKKSEFEGRPILMLPERTTEVDNPEFNDDERQFYDSLEAKTRIQFNRYVAEGSVGREYSHVLVLLLRLRQAACHPHLIKDFAIASVAGVEPSDLITLAESLKPEVVNRIRQQNGSFECIVCYDVTTNPAIFIPCGHYTCAECFARITDTARANDANGGEGGARAKCPNCRGDIDSKKITDFVSFKKVHQHELLTDEERQELNGEESEADEEGSDDEDEDVAGDSETEDDESEDEVNENGDLADFVVKDEDETVKVEESDDTDDLDAPFRPRAEPSRADGSKPKARKAERPGSAKPKKDGMGKGKGKGKGKKEKRKKKKKDTAVTLADLKRLGSRNIKARKAYLRKLRDTFVSSAKLDKTLEIMHTILDAEDEENENSNSKDTATATGAPRHPEKILIFSQWTSLLDLLEIAISKEGWDNMYRRYDGSMRTSERADAVDEFRANNRLRIMLVSLKAGNAGLNLNMASQVIILDPFWNPYIEEQAIDRAHRLGQMRPVKVHRMLVEKTVEDRIVEIQEKKRELISTALDEKAGQSITRLGVQELAYLFGVTRNVNQRIQYQPQNGRGR